MYEIKNEALIKRNYKNEFLNKNHWNCLSLYPKFIENYSDNNEQKKLEEHFDVLLGVTLELEESREKFIKTGDLKELFATAYFHTTFCKIEQILEGVYLYPIEKMKQICYFYQAYSWNRFHWENSQKHLVEKHWIPHFEKTEKKLTFFSRKKYIGHVLATAIEAHVDYDLPRALNFAIKNRHLKNIEEPIYLDAIYEEFLKTEVIFETVTDKTNTDIETAGLCNKLWLDFFSKSYGKLITKNLINPFTHEFVFTDNDVIAKRISAWKKATTQVEFLGPNNEKLSPQPTLEPKKLESKGRIFLSNFLSKIER